MPTDKTPSDHVNNVLIDFKAVSYTITSYVLADKWVQLTSKLPAVLFTRLGLKHMTTTAYDLLTNAQVRKVQSDDILSTVAFCWQNLKQLGQTWAAHNIKVYHTGVQVQGYSLA